MPSIKRRKVKQGQIITLLSKDINWATLHYEVVVNGKNKFSEFIPSGKTLKGDERKQFELDRIKIDLKLAELR